MGLAVEVGLLADLLENDPEGAEWYTGELELINGCLREQGLPVHNEPKTLPPLENRSQHMSFPYSFLHYLRRAYAHAFAEPGWVATPVAEDEDPTQDQCVLDESLELRSHLLVHSDSEGAYIPIDFEEPLFGDENMSGGGMTGSSQRLLAELILTAPSLGITLDEGKHLSDDEAKRINKLIDDEVPLFIELIVWLCLYEAARLSIEHKAAISFC